jgi:hypothetical protein
MLIVKGTSEATMAARFGYPGASETVVERFTRYATERWLIVEPNFDLHDPAVGTMHSAIMTFLGDKRNHDIDGIELKYPKLPGSM